MLNNHKIGFFEIRLCKAKNCTWLETALVCKRSHRKNRRVVLIWPNRIWVSHDDRFVVCHSPDTVWNDAVIGKVPSVFHLAAQPIVRDSYKDPAYTYETNVMGTVNILECIRSSNCVRSFLNITTDKVLAAPKAPFPKLWYRLLGSKISPAGTP